MSGGTVYQGHDKRVQQTLSKLYGMTYTDFELETHELDIREIDTMKRIATEETAS